MKIAKLIAWICLIAMTIVLAYGFTIGNFLIDGGEIIQNPWGIVSLVDLYAGFSLFSIWIAFREKKTLPTIVWIVLMMTLGFWAGALYTLIALYQSQNDWQIFWKGRPSEKSHS